MNQNRLRHHYRSPGSEGAAGIGCEDRKIRLIVVYALATAMALSWIALLPTAASSNLTKLSLAQHFGMADDSINRANKGDRLAGMKFDERWTAAAAIINAGPAAQRAEKIPDGCEPAFSRFVKAGNFSARCIARVDSPLRLAAVE
jgi:hypothetical protein